MGIEITREMVDGYVAAVAAALEAAGHKVEGPTQDYPEELKAEIVLPDAWTDESGRTGVALLYDHDGTWVAGRDAAGWVAACYDPATKRQTLHTALLLGAVPAPEMVVRSVAAVVADGSLRAGQVVPGTAELLAQYAGGTSPAKSWRLDLIALTEGDDDGSFEHCIGCGAGEVAHRALYVTLEAGVVRTAWCAAGPCDDDRRRSREQAVPVARGDDGAYRVADSFGDDREERARRGEFAGRIRGVADTSRAELMRIARSLEA